MTEESNGNIQAAIDAGIRISDLSQTIHFVEENGKPFIIAPSGYAVIDMDKYLTAPRRIERSQPTIDADSFIEYVNRFKTDSTLIFASSDSDALTAEIDYHAPDKPSWREHKAILKLKKSPEWDAWASKDRKTMTQIDFAEFLEDRSLEIAEPTPAVVYEAITKIKLVRTQSTKAIRNLSNGEVQLAYFDEEKQAEGTTIVPSKLTLGLRYFLGQDKYKATARLRYRPSNGGGVTFMYLIDDLDKIAEKCFKEICDKVKAATQLPVLIAS